MGINELVGELDGRTTENSKAFVKGYSLSGEVLVQFKEGKRGEIELPFPMKYGLEKSGLSPEEKPEILAYKIIKGRSKRFEEGEYMLFSENGDLIYKGRHY